ncbi:MAG: SDR family oxidoreductase [Proteobacteria bacterium]|nr:SDR family oxidoreductase [Pseudomonadota bacterium]HQR03829.1 SDR family oxidoreductase [Rhodocyclaceae bacterium]
MTQGRLQDKVIVVAGGGSGIGAATALRLATEGARVVVGDLRAEAAEAVAGRIVSAGGTAVATGFDIAEDDSVAGLVALAVSTWGGLDGIHINAADLQVILRDSDILDEPLEVLDRTLQVNLRGHVLCVRHAVPELLRRGGGAIVHTSSGAAHAGDPERPAYAMSKAAIHALARHVASRWGKQGIRANVICPGLVLTDAIRQGMNETLRKYALAGCRTPRLGEPEDIAAMVAMLLSPDAEWISGQIISVDGGATMRP